MNIAQALLAQQPEVLVALLNLGLLLRADLEDAIAQPPPTAALMQHDHYIREGGAIVQRGWAS